MCSLNGGKSRAKYGQVKFQKLLSLEDPHEYMLYSKDLYDSVEGEKAKPTVKSDAEWKRMNKKAIALI